MDGVSSREDGFRDLSDDTAASYRHRWGEIDDERRDDRDASETTSKGKVLMEFPSAPSQETNEMDVDAPSAGDLEQENSVNLTYILCFNSIFECSYL